MQSDTLGIDHVRTDITQLGSSDQTKVHLEFVLRAYFRGQVQTQDAAQTHLEDLQASLNTLLAISRHRVQKGSITRGQLARLVTAAAIGNSPSDTNGSGTERYRFQDIGGSSHSTINHDLEVGHGPHLPLFQLGNDFDQDFNS
jgi:hypothetical protein